MAAAENPGLLISCRAPCRIVKKRGHGRLLPHIYGEHLQKLPAALPDDRRRRRAGQDAFDAGLQHSSPAGDISLPRRFLVRNDGA